MIARTWRGSTRAEDADRYLAYLHETGFKQYRSTPGNRGVFGLRRFVDGRAEFLLVTLWESHEAVRAFAGDDPDRAVFYPEDDKYLVTRDLHVDHFDVVFAAGNPAEGQLAANNLEQSAICSLHRLDLSASSHGVGRLILRILGAGIPLGGAALTCEQTRALLERGHRVPVHGFDVLMLGSLVRQTAEWRQGGT